jgi:hypothetical protein
MKIRGIAAGLGASGLLVAGVAGPAQAVQPVAKMAPYAQHFSFDTTDCGLNLHYESDVSGRSSIHPAPGSDEAFLFHDNYQFTETITLASDPDGAFVTTQANGNFIETSATLLDPAKPTIYQFTTVDAGTFRLYGPDGTLLVHSTGVFKTTNIQDTMGDKAPGSAFLEETSVEAHGLDRGDFCEAVTSVLAP